MFSRLRSLLFAMSLLSMLGCSPTSKEIPASLAELRVKIAVEDHTVLTGDSNHARTSIRAVLGKVGGGDIERPDVKIEVNGVAMKFHVGRGNYYDRYPSYSLDEDPKVPVAPATDYRFVLVLPDGARHEIGTVRTPAALFSTQIDFPKKRPASGAVTIGWRDVAEPTTLVLYRSEMRRESEGTIVVEGSGMNDPAAPRRTIGPGWFRSRSDKWAIPEKLLASDASRTLLSVGAEFLVVSEGKVSATFSNLSTLRAERKLVLDMEFAKVP